MGEFGQSADKESGGQISRAIKAAAFKGARDSFLDIPGIANLDVGRVVDASESGIYDVKTCNSGANYLTAPSTGSRATTGAYRTCIVGCH